MQGKKKQFIFGLIGLGCGIVLSGIFNLLLLLNTTEYKKGITLSAGQITQEALKSESKEDVLGASTNLQSVKDEALQNEEDKVVNEEKSDVIEKETTGEVEEVLITVTIPPHKTATETCEILEAAGVVSDAKDFRNYISERKMTTKLNEGTFILSKNMTYNELLDKLMID